MHDRLRRDDELAFEPHGDLEDAIDGSPRPHVWETPTHASVDARHGTPGPA